MTTINLKRYYPYMTENMTMEVSDEIAAVLSMGGRLCDSYKRQKRRNSECSLGHRSRLRADVLHGPMTPDEYMDKQERDLALYDALAQLPPVQAGGSISTISSARARPRLPPPRAWAKAGSAVRLNGAWPA